MSLGATVRRRFGRFESTAADAYRSYFIRLDDLAERLRAGGSATRILEIGCGDGSLATALVATFPDATYRGIDIAPEPGRLFAGDRHRVTFRSQRAEELLPDHAGAFDLVVLCDVLHHVPRDERPQLVRTSAALTDAEGRLVIKDWERSRSVAHALTFASDRYVSGDRGVRFFSPGELGELLSTALPDWRAVEEAPIRPHRNNVLTVVRPGPGARR